MKSLDFMWVCHDETVLFHQSSFFFSLKDAQLDRLKNYFKFALKLTLKAHTYFGVKHHHQEAHYLSLAKVTIVKMS
jgi:hypothetical protein